MIRSSSPRRRWGDRFPRGKVVQHPAVLELVGRGDPGTRPRLHIVQGRTIVAYSSTRVFMKRDAWEMMPADGLLVQWIRPKGETPWAIAFTRAELEDVFGEVQESESWEEARCYHFPQVPEATRSFRVLSASSPPAPRAPRQTVRRRTPATPASAEATTEAPSTVDLAERVLRHLREHGSLTEAELTNLAGGSRGYRRLRRHFDKEGIRLHLEHTAHGVLWRLAEDR